MKQAHLGPDDGENGLSEDEAHAKARKRKAEYLENMVQGTALN